MNNRVLVFAQALTVMVVASSVLADSVTIESSQDNSINSVLTLNSNGAGTSIFTGLTGPNASNALLRALVQFDVAGNIPPGSTINSATLTLRLRQAGPAGPQTYTFQRVTQAWGEGISSGAGGSLAPAAAGDATWTDRIFPGTLWGTAGGDFSGTVSASLALGAALIDYTWASNPQLVADVQDMLDNPASNNGWILRGNEALATSAHRFASHEDPTAAERPRLTVDFTPPEAIPTVSGRALVITAVLMLGAGAVVIRRRLVTAAS